MSSDSEIESTISGVLDTRFLKAGATTLLIPLEPKIAELIGRVVVHWGGFEHRMNMLIKAFHEMQRKEPPVGWERLSFKKRKEIWRDVFREYLPAVGWHDTLARLEPLPGRAAALHWKRNIIAHGVYRMYPYDGGIKFVAYGEIRGRSVSIEIVEDTISKLWHDIAHLNGELMGALFAKGVLFDHPDILIEDRSLL